MDTTPESAKQIASYTTRGYVHDHINPHQGINISGALTPYFTIISRLACLPLHHSATGMKMSSGRQSYVSKNLLTENQLKQIN